MRSARRSLGRLSILALASIGCWGDGRTDLADRSPKPPDCPIEVFELDETPGPEFEPAGQVSFRRKSAFSWSEDRESAAPAHCQKPAILHEARVYACRSGADAIHIYKENEPTPRSKNRCYRAVVDLLVRVAEPEDEAVDEIHPASSP